MFSELVFLPPLKTDFVVRQQFYKIPLKKIYFCRAIHQLKPVEERNKKIVYFLGVRKS